MQIQHVDLYVSSFEVPQEGDYVAPLGEVRDHLVKIIGSSGVCDTWIVPLSNFADLSSMSDVSVTPVEDNSCAVLLSVGATKAEARVGFRVYVLSQ